MKKALKTSLNFLFCSRQRTIIAFFLSTSISIKDQWS